MSTIAVSRNGELKGFKIHGFVTIGVVCLLAVINLNVTPWFLWFLFPLAGMSAGLAIHYFLGVRKAK